MARRPLVGFPIFAWFDLIFYGEQGRASRGIGLVPLTVMATLMALVYGLGLGWSYWSFVSHEDTQAVIAQVPEFSIRDGRASSPVEQPWERIIDDGDSLQTIYFGIDTTGAITEIPDEHDGGILLTRTAFIVHNADGRKQQLELQDLSNFEMGPEEAASWLSFIGWVGIPVLAAASLAWTVLVRLTLMLTVGAVLMAIGRQWDLTLAGGMRLAMLGMVPTMFVFLALDLTGWIDPIWTVTWFGCLFFSAVWWTLGLLGVQRHTVAEASGPVDSVPDGASPWQPPLD